MTVNNYSLMKLIIGTVVPDYWLRGRGLFGHLRRFNGESRARWPKGWAIRLEQPVSAVYSTFPTS